MNNLPHDFSSITFITGNRTKAEEMSALLPGIKILAIDLPELQELDNEKIITAKLAAARAYTQGPLLVEDGGLYLDCLGGQLPGPLIKWFLKSIHNTGLINITRRLNNDQATVVSTIGYSPQGDSYSFFTGSMRGTIVQETGQLTGCGWDTIFIPAGFTTTFAELDLTTKNSMSMRAQAVARFKEYLTSMHNLSLLAQERSHQQSTPPDSERSA